ncbi:glycosyltransferase family 2 protein [Candidatus Peregrinibacteria bacterium]|nr:glycosyltransferase family 2 protein [Candidatus Peregrinibacteria bacterium]MBI3815922.1 glycosyltransferase family 2 protein [Candidatus Peregrinibacteria bacterium]
MNPIVSCIVLNYRTPRETHRCVNALLAQTINAPPSPLGGEGWNLEILIVDNHSDDESIQWLRNSFCPPSSRGGGGRGVAVLETPCNLGYGQGNDFGIHRARGKYILIINPDNELEPRGLETMIAAMEADASIGILAPQLVHEDGTIRDSYRTFPTPTDIFIKRSRFLRSLFPHRMRRYLQHAEDPHTIRDVDWIAGACLLMRRDFYHSIGGFDPRFFLFFEDTDLCRRVWTAGKRVIYFPAVHATDRKHRLSEGGILSILTKRATRIHLWSAARYFWKWSRFAAR